MTEPDRQPDADAPRPWEEPGMVRRDCEPHRGGVLRALGIASLVVPPAGLLIAPLIGFVGGIALGLTVWALAGRDLAKMDAGLMDPDGRRATMSARRLGLTGVLVSLGMLVLLVLVVSALMLWIGH
jgi:hypothetical protein